MKRLRDLEELVLLLDERIARLERLSLVAGRVPKQRRVCEEYLKDAVPVAVSACHRRMSRLGISLKTIQRACLSLGIVRMRSDGRWIYDRLINEGDEG